MYLVILISIPSLIYSWQIVLNQDRQTTIKGVLFPKYVVQFVENETLTDADRLEIFNSWGKITTAGRNSIEIVRQDAICYPGPITNGSLFMCGFLTRANETLAEAREFFQEVQKLIESNGTTPSKQNIDATTLSEFSRHWEAVNQLQQSLQLAQGSFTELDNTIELGLDLLNYFSPPTIQTLITGSFEDKFNQNSSHTPPFLSKKKPCPWTSTEIDAFLQGTGAPFDWLQQFTMIGNDTRFDQDICGIPKELRHEDVCNRTFWQKNFTALFNSSFFKKINLLFGSQLSQIEKFVDYAQNLSLSDQNFTSQCHALLNRTNLGKIISDLKGNFSLASITKQINGTINLLPTLPLAMPSVSSIKAALSSLVSSPTSTHASGNLAKDAILAGIGPKYAQLHSILSKSIG